MWLLDPEALAKIHRLDFLARGVMEGSVTGRHRSPFRGSSVEFAEHREYANGDDIRALDWRVYGKSDRYYVKQYEDETNLRATILLDASGSMGYTGNMSSVRRSKRLSKFDYGRYLAASLLHLMIHQQDAVGLVTFDTEVRRYLPSRGRVSHLRALLEELHNTAPGGETSIAPILHDVAERIKRRGLVIIISDLFDDPAEILKALHHFRFRKHEVVLMHVMAEEELCFPFEKWSEFEDLEVSANRIELDPRATRAAYLDEVRKFVKAIRKGCGEMRIEYMPISTRKDFDVALLEYLAGRMRMNK
ncbi:MAG TPA: DUF58 domain-containing protein [Lentisphaeria bacterium]|nr:DUF58 domain-containing protein [Lentisphaeria bacterium]